MKLEDLSQAEYLALGRRDLVEKRDGTASGRLASLRAPWPADRLWHSDAGGGAGQISTASAAETGAAATHARPQFKTGG